MSSNRTTDLPRAEPVPLTDEAFARTASGNVRDDLLAGILAIPLAEAPLRRRRLAWRGARRVPVMVAASTGAVVASGAIAWAVVTSGATDTVSVQCEINGADSIIPATSGNPVSDCAAQWERETGEAAPALRAYDNGHGGVTVSPAAQAPPPSATPLPPGTTQNVSAITLQETLDDFVAGLNATCHTSAEAVTFVRGQLDAAGLSDWSVQPPPQGGDGNATCANTAIVDAKSHSVLLRALTGPADEDASLPYMKLAEKLRGISGCLTASELGNRVQAAANSVGLSAAAHQYQLTEVTNSSSCAIVHETVGGTIFLTVRGPAR